MKRVPIAAQGRGPLAIRGVSASDLERSKAGHPFGAPRERSLIRQHPTPSELVANQVDELKPSLRRVRKLESGGYLRARLHPHLAAHQHLVGWLRRHVAIDERVVD